MKKEVVVSAKTVEEALSLAAEQLGIPADALEYTVIEEPKKGLFGLGAVPAKISAFARGGEYDALEFIKKLMADMQIEAEIEMCDGESADHKVISVSGEGAAVLIGHHGETLDSLQYLANLSANKKVNGVKREFVKITVDVEGYRAKREETLRALARRKAQQVLKYKKSVMLEPMNPYERRIIHSEVQKIEGVSTNSIGSENNRKVVMYLDTKGE
ncbi:MAG: protein jag [Clostridia bacterium]|nr:protein jag [Clostridia bacterium]